MTTKYMKFHKECLKNNRKMPQEGLCRSFHGYYAFTLLTPTFEDKTDLIMSGKSVTYWGSDSKYHQCHKYTTLRETIILFCHEIEKSI